MRATWCLGFFLLAACEASTDDGVLDSGTDSGVQNDSGTNDSGTQNDGGTNAGPILDRTPDLAYDCTGALPVTEPVDRSWNGNGWTYGLAESGGDVMFGRIEREGDQFGIPTAVEALISTLSADGTRGTPTAIPIATPDEVSSVAMASSGSSVLFAYADRSGAHVFRVTGTDVVGPTSVLPAAGTSDRVVIAMRSDGGAILFGSTDENGQTQYRLQTIDLNGAPVGSPFQVVRATTYFNPGANIIATADGYAVAWRDRVTETGEIYFRLFDATGQPAGDTKTVYMGSTDQEAGASVGFEATRVPFIAIDGGFLVAWVEAKIAFDSGAYAVVAVAKLDASGNRIGDRALLMNPEVDIDHVEPEFFVHGDSVGLAWSRGTHIYICGGCVPDHSIRLVLLDPDRLIPVSGVAEIDDDGGGLLFRSMLSNGTDIFAVFRIVFHVTSQGGLAAFRCTPR
jgi:hypothetical protein